MKPNSFTSAFSRSPAFCLCVLLAVSVCLPVQAFQRYSSCSDCHGSFTGSTSPKGTVFPSGDKHEMHRSSSHMGTACDLCHTSGDGRNPYIKSSNGTANNPGLGCTGCHVAEGLRARHAKSGVTLCAGCHQNDGPPPPENVKPPYYGTVDTKADNPSNDVLQSKINENWSVGDFKGLDNDGNGLYDLADFACGPYRILSVSEEGDDLRITWETAGGRSDALQASSDVAGGFADVADAIAIPGVGIIVTNYLEIGAAKDPTRFYRLRFAP